MADKKEKIKKAKVIDAKTQELKNQRKEKIINYLKDFGLSIVKTKNLFRWGVKHWVTPLLVFVILASCVSLPQYFRNTSLPAEEIINSTGTLYSDKVISYILTKDIPCKIEEGYLKCEDDFSYVETYTFTNDYDKTISYDIYINAADTLNERDDDEYFKVEKFEKPGDNYIAFRHDSFLIRYVSRNYDTGAYQLNRTTGMYNHLEGMDFKKLFDEASKLEGKEKQEFLDNTADRIISLGYKSAINEVQFVQLTSNLFSYTILILIVALLIKGNYLLNRKKGFRYSQCIKISIMASIQSYLIALVLSLFGFDLVTIFGLALTVRTLYLWLRYTASKKNTQWLQELYEYSKDERFLLTQETK